MSDAISSRPIAKIKIGQRHRHDHGDIDGLAQNIAEIGLLHPIVIRPDGRLIAGARRLRAFKRLKRDRIPVTVIDLEKVVLGEYAENVFRKAFTPSEMVEIADDIEPLQMLEAKKRQLAGKGEDGSGGRGKKKNPTGNSHKVSRAPTAMDRVARVVGKDRRTLEKARVVVRAAKAEPEKFGALKEDMDASGKVDRAFKMKRAPIVAPMSAISLQWPKLAKSFRASSPIRVGSSESIPAKASSAAPSAITILHCLRRLRPYQSRRLLPTIARSFFGA
jgi:hypothetical protein